MATFVSKENRVNFVSRGKMSPEQLQEKLKRKSHTFSNKKKKDNALSCRKFKQYQHREVF